MNADLDLLRTFVAAADGLHFARAAEARHLDPSGVSRQIRQLERRLGVRLFDRSTRRVQLTAEGEALLPAARTAVESSDEVDALARTLARRRRAELRVGIMTHAVAPSMVEVLRRGAATLGGLDLTFVEAEFVDPSVGVRSGDTDIAVVFTPFDDRGLDLTPLFELPQLVVFPDGHRLASLPQIRFEDIADEPWAVPRTTDQIFFDFWTAQARRVDHPLVIGRDCRTAEEGLMAAMSGSAVTVGATSREGFQVPGLTIRPVEDLPPCGVALATRAGTTDRRLAELVELVQRSISSARNAG